MNSKARIYEAILAAIAGIFLTSAVCAENQAYPQIGSTSMHDGEYTKYTLKKGETLEIISRKFDVSLKELREMNQYIDKGIDNVSAGDSVLVPIGKHSDTENKLANIAIQSGSYLSRSHTKTDDVGILRNQLTDEANKNLQKRLSSLGNVELQINTDEDFTFKNSSFKLLHPWYDTPQNMAFSETGIHRKDNRTQANMGIGWRHFTQTSVIGSNFFLDYDLTRDHARSGIGIEYWKKYLKLSANDYIRLTNWKDSPDLNEYEERPANGWDLRAAGYLPAWPKLGAKVIYEQYYGNEVALFGYDHRQHNPHAITLGMNYTPFPLMTIGMEKRVGKNDENDTRLDLEFHYQFGIPVYQQLDGDNVNYHRSLLGSRYDMVDRSNDITLEYRKKELIKLILPAQIHGYEHEKLSIPVNVQSTYGVKDIKWDMSSIQKYGGDITNVNNSWVITLPDYQTNGVNDYSISAVAEDRKGRFSQRASISLNVTEDDVDLTSSSITADDKSIPADSVSSTSIVVTLKTRNGKPLTGEASNISLSSIFTPTTDVNTNGKPKLTQIGEKPNSPGIYLATLISGQSEGDAMITAEINKKKIGSVDVKLIKGSVSTPDISKSILSAAPLKIKADGKNISTLTLELHNADNAPISDMSISHDSHVLTGSAANGATLSAWEAQGNGVYHAQLSGTTPGEVVVTPTQEGSNSPLVSSGQKVTLENQNTDPAHSNLIVSPDKIVADGKTQSKLVLTLHDINDHPVTGLNIAHDSSVLKDSDGSGANTMSTLSSWSDNKDGTYTSTLTGKKVGKITVIPVLVGSDTPLVTGKDINLIQQDMPALPIDAVVILSPTRTWDARAKVPSVGVSGAKFQILMDRNDPGSNANYTWSPLSNDIEVAQDGTVTMKSYTKKTSSISIVEKNTNKKYTYTYKVDVWFGFASKEIQQYEASPLCKSQGYEDAADAASYIAIKDQPQVKAAGGLFNEWGTFDNNGWIGSGKLWVNIPDGQYMYALNPIGTFVSSSAKAKYQGALCITR